MLYYSPAEVPEYPAAGSVTIVPLDFDCQSWPTALDTTAAPYLRGIPWRLSDLRADSIIGPYDTILNIGDIREDARQILWDHSEQFRPEESRAALLEQYLRRRGFDGQYTVDDDRICFSLYGGGKLTGVLYHDPSGYRYTAQGDGFYGEDYGGTLILTEGVFKANALNRLGYSAWSLQSNTLSRRQRAWLPAGRDIRYLGDNDQGGREGARQVKLPYCLLDDPDERSPELIRDFLSIFSIYPAREL